jgi:GntR family transcriptional regulator / MocR family aminotransferase
VSRELARERRSCLSRIAAGGDHMVMTRRRGVGSVPCIHFDRTSEVPFYVQIYDGYRNAIVSGQLAPGQRLPSTRIISEELEISRFPTLSAFDRLLDDGYIVGRVGSGTFVRDQIPEELTKPISLRKSAPTMQVAEPLVAASHDGSCPTKVGPFSVGIPALDRFPGKVFSRLVQRHVLTSPDAMTYGDPAGYHPLREAIAEYLRTARAGACDASQVLIVTGSQMGLAMSAMALTTPDTLVCVEEPGYIGVRQAMALSNAQVIGVGVDDGGIDVTAIKRISDTVKVVCVSPSRQYPLGPAMEVTRRLELLNWAASQNAWIIEDDYDSEYLYSRRPLGALQGMDTGDQVIYIGTFSKVLFPALRLGYVVVPPALMGRFLEVRRGLDICPSMLYQLVLTDFMNEGHLARHLLRMRGLYLARRNALLSAVHEFAADVLVAGNSDAGLHVVTFLPAGVDDQEVVRRASAGGLYPQALSSCYASCTARQGLILGFGGSDESIFPGAVRKLAEIIRGIR